MCTSQQATAPSSAAQALSMVQAGLAFLATCEPSTLPAAAQAETLIGLERAEGRLTAARAAALAAFCAGHGYEADGQFGPKPWLRAVTRVTKAAAAGAMGWMRRLQAHPLVADALAAEAITTSWAREICAWTDRLPPELAEDADRILLAAAAGGAELADLALLAAEMIERCAGPDGDDGGFADRALWLETTLAGAGRLTGDLTPACAAAVAAVLDALSAKAGPEDTRSLGQRRHDALEEACHRLIDSGMLPGRDGQPLQVNVHVDLAELRGLPGASALEAGWSTARAAATGVPGAVYLTGPGAAAAACDAALTPVVSGHIDGVVLDKLTDVILDTASHRKSGDGALPELSDQTRDRLQHTLLQWSIDLLSGPGGLASFLRGQLLQTRFTTLSQPLDLGRTTRTVPPHLRRAVIHRDKHCQFSRCTQPASVCEVHHLIPWSKGGPTSLGNLKLFCRFHHQIVIHRWGWKITCHPDGTTTATSPDGRILPGHSPPERAA